MNFTDSNRLHICNSAIKHEQFASVPGGNSSHAAATSPAYVWYG